MWLTPCGQHIRYFLRVSVIITMGVCVRHKSHFIYFVSASREKKTRKIIRQGRLYGRINVVTFEENHKLSLWNVRGIQSHALVTTTTTKSVDWPFYQRTKYALNNESTISTGVRQFYFAFNSCYQRYVRMRTLISNIPTRNNR